MSVVECRDEELRRAKNGWLKFKQKLGIASLHSISQPGNGAVLLVWPFKYNGIETVFSVNHFFRVELDNGSKMRLRMK